MDEVSDKIFFYCENQHLYTLASLYDSHQG